MSAGASNSIPSVTGITKLPPEILLKIIIYLNARERIALANSSNILHNVVCKYNYLLKDLDFSKEGRLTVESDIQEYFNDENTSKHLLKVNVRNVNCLGAEQMLNYIGKALNLVDINIHGIDLKDIAQLGNFLKPLLHVKNLSIDWPKTVSTNDVAVLQKPFGILTYLSVKIYSDLCMVNFITTLKYCQELKELHTIQDESNANESEDFRDPADDIVLKNLEILEFSGNCAYIFEEIFMNILPDPMEWTNFPSLRDSDSNPKGFYLEKNIQICDTLAESRKIDQQVDFEGDVFGNLLVDGVIRPDWRMHVQAIRPENPHLLQVPLILWEYLLKTVINTIRGSGWNDLCCLAPSGQCRLKIEEAKELLKNPRYPITYLYISHSIDTECDAHRLVLAFPSLTELHLSNLTRSNVSGRRVSHSRRSLGNSGPSSGRWSRYHDDLEDEECFPTNYHLMRLGANPPRLYIDSCFKMVVDHTPRVTDLTLNAEIEMLGTDEAWDLEALDQIPGWKRLKYLRLSSIPIVHGEFLIEIGKKCTRIEKLQLHNLGPGESCCYIKELLLMLPRCKNLMDFSMKADNVRQVSELVVSLAKNLKLTRVHLVLTTPGENNGTTNLISAVEQLLRACRKLTTFVCIIDGISQDLSDQLTSLLRRLREELIRPTLQFQVVHESGTELDSTIDTIREDSFPPSFPYNL